MVRRRGLAAAASTGWMPYSQIPLLLRAGTCVLSGAGAVFRGCSRWRDASLRWVPPREGEPCERPPGWGLDRPVEPPDQRDERFLPFILAAINMLNQIVPQATPPAGNAAKTAGRMACFVMRV